MPRTFNTTGPCEPDRHYMLPAEGRLPNLLARVQAEQNFVVHAPRQTGKTTAIRAFAARLRGLGYAAVWATLEESQGVDLVEEAEALWITAIAEGWSIRATADATGLQRSTLHRPLAGRRGGPTQRADRGGSGWPAAAPRSGRGAGAAKAWSAARPPPEAFSLKGPQSGSRSPSRCASASSARTRSAAENRVM